MNASQGDLMTAEQVAAYLRQHTDFFEHHEDLLDELFIPHPHTGDAISLLERLIARQRTNQSQTSRQLEALLGAARDSERVVSSLHHLSLELMGCDNLDDVVATSRDIMCSEFDADNVVMRLIGRGHSCGNSLYFIDPDDNALKMMSGLFQKRQPICGRLRPKQQIFLFGEGSIEIKSAVLIPLYEARTIGVLALGSQREDRFHPGMGTHFLSQLGELVSRALSLHLEHGVMPVKSSGT
ncbi:MAG: Unknown protein [uncultured Thiotrichaceae bacterium]|uniref:DUF484 domain-containing protein n=1 Tax=uncultured Thiotrichaceae bacterium TaxID=298394 RepID=A0A6S6SNG1_9GAMM|nr:MAG: Unknown protein [uncultured Thiotrichaceae bacterium]